MLLRSVACAHTSEAVCLNSHSKLTQPCQPIPQTLHGRLLNLAFCAPTYLHYLRMSPLEATSPSQEARQSVGSQHQNSQARTDPGCSGLLPGRMTLSTAQPAACCARNSFSSCCDQTVTKVHINHICRAKTHARTEIIVASAILRPKSNSHKLALRGLVRVELPQKVETKKIPKVLVAGRSNATGGSSLALRPRL